ncbi:MAG: hypothetical protein DRJ03_25310, partial [Chloroflexi bacterium]
MVQPVVKLPEKPLTRILIVFSIILLIVFAYQFLPLVAYGVPGVIVHQVFQTAPSTKTVNIVSNYGEWIAYEYSRDAEAKWESLVGKRLVQMRMTAKFGVKIELSSLASPRFLTEVKLPPFLVEETETELHYKNITIHAYAYSFRVTIAWTGDVSTSILKTEEWGIIPWTVPSQQDMVKNLVQNLFIPDFNNHWTATADILLSLDAPTLASDMKALLRPDYLGIAGMWLQDYSVEGHVSGTAAECQPQITGTEVTLYRDKDLQNPCWSPSYSGEQPVITEDVGYWLDHFAARSAWWQINIINLGSKLVYDESQTYPNYAVFAWQKYGSQPPSVT